ncbi:uncharacterized protein TRIADDRAFT_54998 [Trichoplax adhaerens]|uniref:Probable RNA polymerase II nuclear localization protein SLC7A6OS n=1 Tax=Trichoplax adhaerens TaxID=10228 RepID=B3RQI1_TRIAD|nr:hypothetical protein TRIADDRAFT_54998 [Trichoplax adhaerens]EDV27249.1 hypothetical protein TRIADDRAFT_54998 [Trichoplax adhaerens]|eukprot:XP_002111245.1 hypothetical protein TRIADDRAFT_54998 [Trichoplax adhaerens]
MATNDGNSSCQSQSLPTSVLIRIKRKISDLSDESAAIDQPASKHSKNKNNPRGDKGASLLFKEPTLNQHKLFQFIGTVNSTEDKLVKTTVVDQLNNSQGKRSFSKHHKVDIATIKSKLKKEQLLHREKQRFKIVSHRIAKLKEIAIQEQSIEDIVSNGGNIDQGCGNCEIVDVEELQSEVEGRDYAMQSGITCNGVEMTIQQSEESSQSNAKYTYDLYWCRNSAYRTNDEFTSLGNTIEFESFDEQLLTLDHWQQDKEYNEHYYDEDDSNDESNWRNDYPDEDDLNLWEESSDGGNSSDDSEDNYCNIGNYEEENYGYFEEGLRLSDAD